MSKKIGFYCPQCNEYLARHITGEMIYIDKNKNLVSYCPKCGYNILEDIMLLVAHSYFETKGDHQKVDY